MQPERLEVFEQTFEWPKVLEGDGLLGTFRDACATSLSRDLIPVRFVVSETRDEGYRCEVGVIRDPANQLQRALRPIFSFEARRYQNAQAFNVALVIPTGVGAQIGGHAGDAGPVARMLGEVADLLVLHPNVVNASDINEMPENALYVEGSVVTRLLMGTIGLQPVRVNRVLVVIDAHEDELFVDAAINSVSGARAAYGLVCPEVVCLDSPVKVRAEYSESGRATGYVEDLTSLCRLLEDRAGQYDAVALSTVVDVPHRFHQEYFDSQGEMVNPWGGVEAMLTHSLSSIFNVPTAHSPMLESQEIANMDPGRVEPRMAAEAVSTTFLQCTLKGLQRSPKIVTDVAAINSASLLTAADISCLVIPDGCLGLPTLAALEQGIHVVAVRENHTLMANDLSSLPWAPGQFFVADNYWEATGIIASLRAGIDPTTVRRPLGQTRVTKFSSMSSVDTPVSPKDQVAVENIGSGVVSKGL